SLPNACGSCATRKPGRGDLVVLCKSVIARQPGCVTIRGSVGGRWVARPSRTCTLGSNVRRSVSLEPPAKFFVNSGLVSSPTDIYNLLRPLLKQTVSYRYYRGAAVVSNGTGWVERIV